MVDQIPQDDGDFIRLHAAVAGMAGFQLPVLLESRLHDRLEVPEEWQWAQSFDQRALNLLHQARRAMTGTQAPKVPFRLPVPSNLTGRPEELDLMLRFEGETMLVYFAEDD